MKKLTLAFKLPGFRNLVTVYTNLPSYIENVGHLPGHYFSLHLFGVMVLCIRNTVPYTF